MSQRVPAHSMDATDGLSALPPVEAVDQLDAEVLLTFLTQPLARVAYSTGWRKGELLNLQWWQVDLAGGTIRLENDQTKTGKGRVYAFAPEDSTDEVAQVLRAQHESRRLDCPYVFHRNGQRIRDCYHAWRAAAERAGRVGLHLHDFRRSTARNLDRAGVPTGIAMTVMGHCSSSE